MHLLLLYHVGLEHKITNLNTYIGVRAYKIIIAMQKKNETIIPELLKYQDAQKTM